MPKNAHYLCKKLENLQVRLCHQSPSTRTFRNLPKRSSQKSPTPVRLFLLTLGIPYFTNTWILLYWK